MSSTPAYPLSLQSLTAGYREFVEPGPGHDPSDPGVWYKGHVWLDPGFLKDGMPAPYPVLVFEQEAIAKMNHGFPGAWAAWDPPNDPSVGPTPYPSYDPVRLTDLTDLLLKDPALVVLRPADLDSSDPYALITQRAIDGGLLTTFRIVR